jgi:hypothetical protein
MNIETTTSLDINAEYDVATECVLGTNALFCPNSFKILRRFDLLLGNARNTHAANNTGAVFSVVRPRTGVMQSALGTFSRARWRHTTEEVMQAVVFCTSEPRHVFSVMRGPCRNYITELNSEDSSGESQENGNTTTYSGVQQIVRELELSQSP